MSQNPFESSRQLPQGYFGDVPMGQPAYSYNRGMMGQVPVVGGLLIGQAILEGIFFILLAGTSVMMSSVPPPPNMPKQQLTFTIGAMVALSAVALVGMIAHLIAGFLMVAFRRRIMTMICLSIGFVSMFTVYCSLTMLPIAIYALIVLLNEPVIWAYAELEKGTSREYVMMGQPTAAPTSWQRPIS